MKVEEQNLSSNMLKYKIFQFADFEKEAQQIIQKAKELAKQIIEESKRQAENIIKDADSKKNITLEKARQEGFNTGYQEGLKKAEEEQTKKIQEESSTLMQTLEKIIHEIASAKQELINEKLFASILEYVMMLVRKIVKVECQINPEVVIENVKQTIQLIINKQHLWVFVNPKDYKALEKFLPQIKQIFIETEQIELQPDENIAPGGCIVKSKQSVIDADIKTQLDLLEQNLFGKTT